MTKKKKIVYACLGLVAAGICIVAGEIIYIQHNGSPVAAPTIPRTVQLPGNGTHLNYVVLGDSTSIGQGAHYKDSYAYKSAEHLAINHEVTLINVGVSGARVQDVENKQVARAVAAKPDIILLAIGANDVTHFTKTDTFRHSLQSSIDSLRKTNHQLPIVITGVPAMGSVARFPDGARQLAAYRTNHLNTIYEQLAERNQLVFAHVAAATGPAFAADHSLFASDKFHPNARGYALWTPVINTGLDTAIGLYP